MTRTQAEKSAVSVFALLFAMLLSTVSTTCFAASVPPQGYPTPIALREMNGGFWRADHTFSPILYITNLLVTNSLQVTPVLYMADGTAYDLPAVTVNAAGVMRVSISDALRVAPAKIQPHISEFGSVGLRYQWHWQNAVSAIVQNLDSTRSLNFNYPLHTAMKMTMPPATIHKQGLWWKEEPNVEASVNLVNVSAHPVSVRIDVLSASNDLRDSQRSVLAPNSATRVELALPEEQKAGGVRVSYHGSDGDVAITGSLEDASIGYSAKIPFTSLVKEDVSNLAVSSVGLMMGKPDPMMGFPHGTKFGVYSAFRNTSKRSIAVTPTLYYMAGASTKVAPLQPLNLAPGEARYWSADNFSQVSGLGNFSGMMNIVFSYRGTGGEIILANGSIDNAKTYVFESELNGVGKSESKGLTAWNLADGNNTMISLLNTGSQDEDLFVTLYHSQGKYRMPVHLKAGASMMFNISDLIMMRTPDGDGNLLPMTATSGSAVVSGKTSDADWIEVAVGIGIFNVTTATCGTMCPTCYGYSDFTVDGDSPNTIIGGTASFSGWGLGQNGQWQRVTPAWSSSNGTVASSQGSGNFGGSNPGNFSALANVNLIDENADCPEGSGHPCPTSPYGGGSPGTVVTPSVSCTTVTRGSSTTCTASSGPNGPAFSTSGWKFTDSASHTVTGSGTGSTWSGTAVQPGTISVNIVVNGSSYPVQTSLVVNARSNFAFAAVSPMKQSNGYTCAGVGTILAPNPPSNGSSVGQFCVNAGLFSFNFATIGTNAGPNSGFSYITSATNAAIFDWVIAPDADNSSSQFYMAQCGNYNPSTNTGYIGGATLQADTTRHESGVVQSHYSNYVVAQNNAANNIGVGLEAAVDMSTGSTFQTFVNNAVSARASSITSATQAEPCGTTFVNYNQSCGYDGPINFSPYAACQ